MKRIITLVLVAVLMFGVGYVVSSFDKLFPSTKVLEEEGDVILEKINTVAKLVTVEGNFSEIYSYKDYYGYNLWALQKKVLLKVKAKVSVGYDLEKMSFTTLPDERKLIISNLPEPEIISIQPEISYFDMYEGVFNSFSEEELTQINKNAVQFVKDKALQSDELLKQAEEQGLEMIGLIEMIVSQSGWEVVYENKNPIIPAKPQVDTSILLN